jgi:dTDP-4-amino-4,6-dideoxygalactose transaminase
MNSKIWLSPPHMGGLEERYVKDAFNTNWIAPLGPNVNGFEHDLAEYLGEQVHVAALISGTAAIHIGLILLNVEAGDEVICQSMTFSASANAISYVNATPVFVDSESETWNMCPELLEEAIKDRIAKGKKVKAIIPVHLYGMPARIKEIMAIAARYGIPVLEDAAESLGSAVDNVKCGTFGDISILSFNGNKIITTSGGGALVSKKIGWVNDARFLASQAREEAPHYQHSRIGYNYRLSNLCAGVGRGQVEVLDERVRQKRAVYDFYRNKLSAIPGLSFLSEPRGFFSNRWLTTILIDPAVSGFTREDLRLKLDAENIESRPLWKPMHMQPVFEQYPKYTNGVSEKLFETGLCLPSGTNLSESDLNRICDIVLDMARK